MTRTNETLEKLLKLLDKKPLIKSKIGSVLKIDRKTVYRNVKEAQGKDWIVKDPVGRYHLTTLGKANIGSTKHPINSESLEAYSQVIDFLKIRPERPTAKCTIVIEDANKIKQLDAHTESVKRFLTHDGLWLPENNTNLKAAVAAVVDSILDLKAKQMGLHTIMDEQFRDHIAAFDHLPGYDSMKRYMELAKTKFNVLIEFNGSEWVEKQNFQDVEKMVEESTATTNRKQFSENIRSMDQTVRINNAIYHLSSIGGSGDLSSNTLITNHLFDTPTELKEYVYNNLKLYQVTKCDNIIEKLFNMGFFSIETRTLHHLKVSSGKALDFFTAITMQLNDDNVFDRSNEHNNTQRSKEGENTIVNSEDKNHIALVSKELEDFEKAFCDCLVNLKEKFETSQVQSFNKTIDPEYPLLIANTLKALLEIFYDMASVYLHRLLVMWPKEVKDKKTMQKLCCIVFAKIAEIRKLIETGLKFVRGGDFEKYFDSYSRGKMHTTNSLLKHAMVFKNVGMEKHSKPLLYSMRKIYEQCK